MRWFIWLVLLVTVGVAERAGAEGAVLFDQFHGQQFVIEKERPLDLSLLAGEIGTAAEVRSSTSPLTDESLAGVRGVILSGPFLPLAQNEIDALLRFVEKGGRLAVMLHIGAPVAPLLHRLGVDVANGVVRQPQAAIGDNPLDFHVSDLDPHPLLRDIERIAFFGAWPLQAFGEQVGSIARSDDSSWVDLDGDAVYGQGDARQSFGLVVAGRIGRGEFVVFGDDAVFQNRFLSDYNDVLAANFAAWIAGGK